MEFKELPSGLPTWGMQTDQMMNTTEWLNWTELIFLQRGVTFTVLKPSTQDGKHRFPRMLSWVKLGGFTPTSLSETMCTTSVDIFGTTYIEKAMAPHSSTLAWKIPWTEEPGRLQSIGSLRVRHDWATSLSLFTFMHWRRKWQPTPVFLPGESQGWGSLMGCRLWGRPELDMTEVT